MLVPVKRQRGLTLSGLCRNAGLKVRGASAPAEGRWLRGRAFTWKGTVLGYHGPTTTGVEPGAHSKDAVVSNQSQTAPQQQGGRQWAPVWLYSNLTVQTPVATPADR